MNCNFQRRGLNLCDIQYAKNMPTGWFHI